MLNQITNKTEVKAHSEKNLTTFTIGIERKRMDRVMWVLINI
jgi:hypothetical protein